MKRLLPLFLLFLMPAAHAQFTQWYTASCAAGDVQCTVTGPSGTGTGDQPWLAFGKYNSNFYFLKNMFGPTSHLALSGSVTASDIVNLFSACTGTEYLGADGGCHPLGTFAAQNYATPPSIGGTTPNAGAFTTLSASSTLTTAITGSTQCLHANSAGQVSGTGVDCSTGGSGTVNSGTQYALAYYATSGTAVSALGNGTTGQVLTATTGASPGWATGVDLTGLSADTSPACGDLLLIYSQSATATESITNCYLFGSTPAISINTGSLSAASWMTAGLALSGTAATLTDSTASGTVTTESAAALPIYTIAATNSITITNLAELYLPAPVAGSNVTGTHLWSLFTGGGAYVTGTLEVQSNFESLGTITLTNGGASHTSWTTAGLGLVVVGGTITDTTGTGTIATEAAMGMGPYTIAASNTGVTVTNLDELYISAPIAGTNVTATNKWSLHTAGNILVGGSLTLDGSLSGATALLYSQSAPTISSGFGSSPSVSENNGTASFSINVGTGGSASSGVVGLPTASHAWSCFASDTGVTPTGQTEVTAGTTTSITLTNYSRTSGLATAWTASEIIQVGCFAN
jgi:hypothetical protein